MKATPKNLWLLSPTLVTCLITAAAAQAGNDRMEWEARAKNYDSLFPYSAELCSHTQIQQKPGFGETVVGGEWGHATIYLKGACRDLSQGYPLIRLCDELPAGPDTAENGVGVSVDADYQNVNWVATPNRSFFYWGDLKPGEKLTGEVYSRTMARARELGILTGVTSFEKIYQSRPANISKEDFRWQDVYGTDFALNFARTSACGRLPLTRSQVARIVDKLNGINRVAHATQNPWDGYSDNCTHTDHNALAASGYWDELGVHQSEFSQAFDVAIPFNDFLRFVRRSRDIEIDNPIALYADPLTRKTLLEDGWLPSHGLIVDSRNIYPDNDVYVTSNRPNFLDLVPILSSDKNEYVRIMADYRLTDLLKNLEGYQAIYKTILASKPDRYQNVRKAYDVLPNLDYKDYERFYDRYYAWIDAQAKDVELKIKTLTDLEKSGH